MNKLFSLLLFSLPVIPSGYGFSFQKVQETPSDIQVYNLSDQSIQKKFKMYFSNCAKTNHTADLKNNTLACVQEFNSQYQIIFSSEGTFCCPYESSYSKKPLCVGVSKDIILILSEKCRFYFVKIPWIGKNVYHADKVQKPVEIILDDKVQELLNTSLGFSPDSQLYCFPGDYGRFYLTYDDKGTKDLYLLTIEEKEQPEEILTPNNGKEPSGLTGNKKFFTIPKILFMSGLVIGLLSIIFKSKICTLISFLKNYK